MKWIVFLVSFSICSDNYSQEIYGIGPLKIGTSFRSIISNSTVYDYVPRNTKIKKGSNQAHYIVDIKEEMYAILIDSSFKGKDWPVYVIDTKPLNIAKIPGISNYYIPYIKIGDEKVADINVFCFGDSIKYIYLSHPSKNLINAIISKFPAADSVNKIDTLKCKYVYTGAVKDVVEFFSNYHWKNDHVTAEYLFNIEFDDACKPSTIVKYFDVIDNKLLDRYNLKVKLLLDDLKHENEGREKKLKDNL